MKRASNQTIDQVVGASHDVPKPQYGSEQERAIGDVLDQYGIPFLYRQTRIVQEQGRYAAWKPTFTLPTYDSLVVEYTDAPFGKLEQKLETYRRNHIPAVFLGPAGLDRPSWDKELMNSIETEYARARVRDPFAGAGK